MVANLVNNASILLHTELCQPPLRRSEPLGRRREVGKDEDGNDRDGDCGGTFNVEKPTPCRMTECSFHSIENPRSKYTTEGVRDEVSTKQDCIPHTKFFASVPDAILFVIQKRVGESEGVYTI